MGCTRRAGLLGGVAVFSFKVDTDRLPLKVLREGQPPLGLIERCGELVDVVLLGVEESHLRHRVVRLVAVVDIAALTLKNSFHTLQVSTLCST